MNTQNYEQAWLPPRIGGYMKKEELSIVKVWAFALKQDALRETIVSELILQRERHPELAFRIELQRDGQEEGYCITREENLITITSGSNKGILYGLYAAMRKNETEEGWSEEISSPACPLRMLNHWDNMDGSIERGYSGQSFFFDQANVIVSDRIKDYARLCASVGINAVVLNNVNVRYQATWLITEEYLPRLREINDILAAYGIRMFLSLNFAAPMEIGGLSVSDPLDEEVQAFWKHQMQVVYQAIPDFGGFLVKADSEGRPGPFTYGRTHADGANMLADAIKPYGGIIIWRCFVYNCSQDWRDQKTDRACAGYNHFAPLDGKFSDNVVLQIKNGPMDFQVREPVSPLFGGMKHTNQMLEVQAAQEYTGQQKHVCYLVPMWKDVLSFHTYCGEQDTVSDIIGGRAFSMKHCGMAAVANTGDDENWTGHDLAAANWYGFGRIAWNPELSAEEIAREWALQTFPKDEQVQTVINRILMLSYEAYENYTSPLGIGWMVNPNHHYGPNVEGYEYDRWGTYHRADCRAIGVERSSKGTGYTRQYLEPNASRFEKPETTPEELLLFFHRIPYDYRLKDGRTLLQYIYDTHFLGAKQVESMIMDWTICKGRMDDKRYERILSRLNTQLASAREWRDRINTYFHRMTLIPDEQGRKIYD